jgi:hypothetical protein
MHPPIVRRVAAVFGLTALAGLAVPAGLAGLAIGTAPAGAASAPTQSSPQAEYQAAIKAASNLGVHFVSVASQGGVTIHVTGDTGATSGAQTLTVSNGKLSEHVSAMVVGSTGYVKANSTALHYVIGLNTSQSNKYANKWLSFPTSNSGLEQLVSGLLASQVTSEIQMSGPYTFGPLTTIGGQKAVAIHGTVRTQSGGKAPVVLYVPATGRPTPIKEVTNPGASAHASAIHGTVLFTNWGQKISQKPPAHSTSLLKLAPPSSSGSTSSTAG